MTRANVVRRAATSAAIHLALLSLLGCGRGEGLAHSRGSSMTVAYCCGREALSPYADMSARYLVFLPLVALDGDGQRVPRLARSWSHSADYREWTYHLRTDVRWDDGVPVTAHDVKFSLGLLAHPEGGYLSDRSGSVTVHDDSTLTISLFIDRDDEWLVYWPKHVLEALDPSEFYEWDFWTDPVGNGPYRFMRYVPETMMEFEANPDYYGPLPGIQRVVLKFAGAAGLAELLAGGVDAITENDPADIHALLTDPRFRIYHGVAETVVIAVVWNGAYLPFQDLRVRRALTLAINRRGLLRALDLPDRLPIADGPYTARQFLRSELPEPLPYDPEAAVALLEEAGWLDLDGDGVREKNGVALRFTAIALADAALEPGGAGLAIHVQGQLRRVGVHMEIRPLEPGLVFDRLKSGDFEAAFTVFQHQAWWLNRFLGDGSRLGYYNPAATRLIDRALAAADPDSVDAIYRDLAEIFRRDLPITFLFPRTESYFVHRRIHGLEGLFYPDPVFRMEHLRIENGDQR